MRKLNKIIAHNIATLRKARGFTQGDIAEKFSYSDKSISKWETGENLPDIEVLDELASFYGVTVDYLLSEHFDDLVKEAGKRSPSQVMKDRIIVTSLGVVLIWTISSGIFASLLLARIYSWPAWMAFVWSFPPSFLVLHFFNKKWGIPKMGMIYEILFVLSTGLALYLELGFDLGDFGWNMWFILIGIIPAIIGIIFYHRAKAIKQ